MEKFNIGDIVKLVSGGPPMTVRDLDPEMDIVYTGWFDNKNTLQYGQFHPNMLNKIEDEILPSTFVR